MFEMKGKVGSAGRKIAKLIRLFIGSKTETLGESSTALSPTKVPYGQTNSRVDLALNVESGIAQALMGSRMLDKLR